MRVKRERNRGSHVKTRLHKIVNHSHSFILSPRSLNPALGQAGDSYKHLVGDTWVRDGRMATLPINARRIGSASARINSLNEVNFQIANLGLSGDRLCILYRAICAQIKYVYLDLNRKIKRLRIEARVSSADQKFWLCG